MYIRFDTEIYRSIDVPKLPVFTIPLSNSMLPIFEESDVMQKFDTETHKEDIIIFGFESTYKVVTHQILQ